MYRSVLPLLIAAALMLGGCTAGQKNMSQETEAKEEERAGQSADMSGEENMYVDSTENVIYMAGGCFWGLEQLMQSINGVIDAMPTVPAKQTPTTKPFAREIRAFEKQCGWNMTLNK